MANKAEFIDMISDATRQSRRRRDDLILTEPTTKERSRLGHWPPERMVQWRMENLTPWKLKSWKYKDWD